MKLRKAWRFVNMHGAELKNMTLKDYTKLDSQSKSMVIKQRMFILS